MPKALASGVAVAVAGLLLPAATSGMASPVPRDRILSNERTVTRWAYVRYPAFVRARPSLLAPAVGRLRLETEDDFPEVYLLLRSRTKDDDDRWLEVRLPGRPNGRTGWVPEDALGPPHVTRWALRIDRSRFRATVFRRGRMVWTAPVGVGAPTSPTPAGRYWIRELITVPRGTIYGPYAFGTSAYSDLSEWPGGGVVGIHGTNEPWLVPGRPSHGCVRMRNADILYLARRLPIGTPVQIV